MHSQNRVVSGLNSAIALGQTLWISLVTRYPVTFGSNKIVQWLKSVSEAASSSVAWSWAWGSHITDETS